MKIRNSKGPQSLGDPHPFVVLPPGTSPDSHREDPREIPPGSGKNRGRVIIIKHSQCSLRNKGLQSREKKVSCSSSQMRKGNSFNSTSLQSSSSTSGKKNKNRTKSRKQESEIQGNRQGMLCQRQGQEAGDKAVPLEKHL